MERRSILLGNVLKRAVEYGSCLINHEWYRDEAHSIHNTSSVLGSVELVWMTCSTMWLEHMKIPYCMHLCVCVCVRMRVHTKRNSNEW